MASTSRVAGRVVSPISTHPTSVRSELEVRLLSPQKLTLSPLGLCLTSFLNLKTFRLKAVACGPQWRSASQAPGGAIPSSRVAASRPRARSLLTNRHGRSSLPCVQAQLGRRGRRLWLSGVSRWLAGSDSVKSEGNSFNVEMTAFKSWESQERACFRLGSLPLSWWPMDFPKLNLSASRFGYVCTVLCGRCSP